MLLNRALAIEIIKDDLSLQIVNLEIADSIISRNIDRALMYASSYYNVPNYVTVDINDTTGTGGYILLEDIDKVNGEPNVNIVTHVYPVNNVVNANAALLGLGSVYINLGLAMDNQMENYANMIQKLSLLESILGRNARVIGDKLYVDHYYDSVTVAYIPNILTIENISDGEWLTWVLEYATALSKRQLAGTRGKFVVASNPSTTNAAELADQAQAKINELIEKLETKGYMGASKGY